MGKEYEQIDEQINRWINRQKLFFVATAPKDINGMVNCSPKGLDTLRVLNPNQLAYLDFPGSGVETIAHIRENKRLTIMMCAFDGPPKIFRFHGHGDIIDPNHTDFETLSKLYDTDLPYRAIIRLDIKRISDSCGYGVPLYEYKEERNSMQKMVSNFGAEKLSTELKEINRQSVDGLPGLDDAILRFPNTNQ